MKHTGLAKKSSRSNGSSSKKRPRSVSQYAVCIKNDDYLASLELRKLYQIVADKTSSALGLIRIIDESGEDYLYPAHYFLPIRLSPAIQKAVQLAS
jgi:hypothetical protein